MPNYLDKARYEKLVRALLELDADPLDHENAIKITLGELANIWSEAINRRLEPPTLLC